MNRLRVAVFVNHIGRGAGARKSATVVAQALEREHEVVVATLYTRSEPGFRVTRHVCLGFERRKARGLRGIRFAVAGSIREARAVAQFCRDEGIDVAVGVLTNRVLALSRLLYQNPAALILSVRNNPAGYEYKKPILLRWPHRVFSRLLYSQADRVVAISGQMKLILEQRYRIKNVSLIYNMYERSLQTPDADLESHPADLPIGPGEVLFLNVARMTRQKGHVHLLRSFAHVASQIPQVKLAIAGGGSLQAEIAQLVQELKLQDRVFLLGRRTDVPALLARADVFVLSSLWEGLPLSVLEALEANLPVIAADCPTGPREILAPEADPGMPLAYPYFGRYGVLTPNFGTYRGTQELRRLPLLEAERVMAAAMKGFADPGAASLRYPAVAERVDDFSFERIGQQWCELVNRVAGGRRRVDCQKKT